MPFNFNKDIRNEITDKYTHQVSPPISSFITAFEENVDNDELKDNQKIAASLFQYFFESVESDKLGDKEHVKSAIMAAGILFEESHKSELDRPDDATIDVEEEEDDALSLEGVDTALDRPLPPPPPTDAKVKPSSIVVPHLVEPEKKAESIIIPEDKAKDTREDKVLRAEIEKRIDNTIESKHLRNIDRSKSIDFALDVKKGNKNALAILKKITENGGEPGKTISIKDFDDAMSQVKEESSAKKSDAAKNPAPVRASSAPPPPPKSAIPSPKAAEDISHEDVSPSRSQPSSNAKRNERARYAVTDKRLDNYKSRKKGMESFYNNYKGDKKQLSRMIRIFGYDEKKNPPHNPEKFFAALDKMIKKMDDRTSDTVHNKGKVRTVIRSMYGTKNARLFNLLSKEAGYSYKKRSNDNNLDDMPLGLFNDIKNLMNINSSSVGIEKQAEHARVHDYSYKTTSIMKDYDINDHVKLIQDNGHSL